jgi:hypothetical protein
MPPTRPDPACQLATAASAIDTRAAEITVSQSMFRYQRPLPASLVEPIPCLSTRSGLTRRTSRSGTTAKRIETRSPTAMP